MRAMMVSVVLAAAIALPTTAMAQDGGFPEGPAKALVQRTCTGCHVGSQVTAQRKSAAEWGATVETMVGYGAQISDAEYATIVDYLASNFGTAGKAAAKTSAQSAH